MSNSQVIENNSIASFKDEDSHSSCEWIMLHNVAVVNLFIKISKRNALNWMKAVTTSIVAICAGNCSQMGTYWKSSMHGSSMCIILILIGRTNFEIGLSYMNISNRVQVGGNSAVGICLRNLYKQITKVQNCLGFTILTLLLIIVI